MKKLVSAAISAALALTTLSMGLMAGATDASQVGAIGDSGVPDAFKGKEAELTQKYKEAYNWGITLHSHKENDGMFNFGDASGELVHIWSGTDPEGNVYQICNQDFDNGTSTVSNAFSYNNWAAIVCADPETLNVVIMRDAAAEWYAKGGGVNNWKSGSPTTNQYWRTENGVPVCYQQFENGHLRIEEGEVWYAEFYSKIDLGADYPQPPAAPPAYGDIYTPNADGCTWEEPKYLPSNVTPPDVTTNVPNNEVPGGQTGDDNQNPAIVDPSLPAGTVDPNSTTASGTASGASSTVSGTTVSGNTVSGNTVSGSTVSGDNNQTASGTSGGTTTVRKMNVGATVGIVVACVVVVGGGAFCLYWFVLRKKKAAADGVDADAADDAAKTEEKSDDKPEDKK